MEYRSRIRKACDACNIRKVKCDGDVPRCQSCQLLDMACTFDRPMRRHGPASRHVDRMARLRRETSTVNTDQNSRSSVIDYAQNVGVHREAHLQRPNSVETAAIVPPVAPTISLTMPRPISDSPSFDSAEVICDIATLKLLIDSYFNFIHPVIPLPHEPTFRAAFARRDDRINRGFLGQIAAMIEVLAASFPRRPMQIFALRQGTSRYPNAGALIEKCHEVLNFTRGDDFVDRDPNLTDALCSYLAGLSAGYTFNMARQRRYLAECIVILRTLKFHKSEAYSPADTVRPLDHIFQQSGRRLFWLCFVGNMSMRQLGGYDSDILIPPSAYIETLPALPLELDDEYIYPAVLLAQPSGVVSRLTGFNINVRIFRAFHRLTALEMLFGNDTVYDWDRQRRSIRAALAEVKQLTTDMPDTLQLHLSHTNDSQSSNSIEGSNRPNADTSSITRGFQRPASDYEATNASNLLIQFEVQKANIYATQLATRSYLVEKYWSLHEIHSQNVTSPTFSVAGISTLSSPPFLETPPEDRNINREASEPGLASREVEEHAMAGEREAIVMDMVLLLRNVTRLNMEPNGISICNKIRQVASTLLSQDRYQMSRMPNLDPDTVSHYLLGFCEILSKLERLGSGQPGPGGRRGVSTGHPHVDRDDDLVSPFPEDGMTAQEIEDEQLVQWASLHEYQERFIRMNGFLDTL